MHPDSRSFITVSGGGLRNVLVNQCGVSQAFNPAGGGAQPPIANFDAIWDTGATNSVITQAVVDACALAPTGITQVHGVNGVATVESYLVNLYLPNQFAVGGVRVTKGDLIGAQMLIGMDIINRGDFAVTNEGGITKFCFRVPSEGGIDFVAEHNRRLLPKRGGSGKSRPKKHKTFGKNKRRKKL